LPARRRAHRSPVSQTAPFIEASTEVTPLSRPAFKSLEREATALSDADLADLANHLAYLHPLTPFPGWSFGLFDESEEPAIVVRKIVWREYRRRQTLPPIIFPWHFGSRLNLHLGNDMSHPTYLGGCIEPNEFAFLAGVLEEGMTFLDIGANEGFFTIFAAARVGDGGRVLAFEPSSREFERLSANISLNEFNWITPIRKAVADRTGKATLKIAEREHEGQNTLGDFVWKVQACADEEVELVTLDETIAEQSLESVDVVKIDVEGAELRVLQGARRMLEEFRPILLTELSEKALGFQGGSAAAVLDCLRAADYDILGFNPETGHCEAVAGLSDNIVAIPTDR
jgi:FkbM family methyltransferase